MRCARVSEAVRSVIGRRPHADRAGPQRRICDGHRRDGDRPESSGIASVEFFVDGGIGRIDTTRAIRKVVDTTSTFDRRACHRAKAIRGTAARRAASTTITTVSLRLFGSLGRHLRRRRARHRGWNGTYRSRGHAGVPAAPRAGRLGDVGRVMTDVRVLQAPTGVSAPGHRRLGQRPDPGAPHVPEALRRTPPPVRGRLGRDDTGAENVIVNDGTTTKTIAITTDSRPRAWVFTPVNSVGAVAGSWSPSIAWPAPTLSQRPVPGRAGTPTGCPDATVRLAAPGQLGRHLRRRRVRHRRLERHAPISRSRRATLALEQGGRATWAGSTTDVRALQAPSGSQRRATADWDNAQIRVRVTFPSAYAGTLHLYAVDWDATTRRQNVTVNDGTTTKTVAITTDFSAWGLDDLPVSVGAVAGLLTVDRAAGADAVLSGLFLGRRRHAHRLARRHRTTRRRGQRVGTFGRHGYEHRRRNGTTDPRSRWCHAPPRAGRPGDLGLVDHRCPGPEGAERSSAADRLLGNAQIRRADVPQRLRRDAPPYAVHWDVTDPAPDVIVTDGTTTKTVAITTDFSAGAATDFPVSVGAGGSSCHRRSRGRRQRRPSGLFLAAPDALVGLDATEVRLRRPRAAGSAPSASTGTTSAAGTAPPSAVTPGRRSPSSRAAGRRGPGSTTDVRARRRRAGSQRRATADGQTPRSGAAHVPSAYAGRSTCTRSTGTPPPGART